MFTTDPVAEARDCWIAQGWAQAAPALAMVASLDRVRQIYVSRLEAQLRPLNLSLARFELLMQLYFSKDQQLSLGRLRMRLQVAPGAVTNAVNRLERDGLVTRVTDPTDARITIATMTPTGRKRALEAAEIVNQVVFSDTKMSLPEMAELFDALAVIRHRAGDFPADVTGGGRAWAGSNRRL